VPIEATARIRRLRDLYRKTAKQHARRWAKFETEVDAEGQPTARAKAALENAQVIRLAARELGLSHSEDVED
jgi:hypothetical protein